MELNGTVRELNGTWGDWHHIFQPELIGIDFFNLDYFNLKPIDPVYPINIRHTRIHILFFRSFWKVRVGIGFAGTILLFRGTMFTILNTYYT